MEQEATIAGLLALAMGLLKVLEVFGGWLVKKMSPDKEGSEKKVVVVQLDPEVSRLIHDTHDKVIRLHDINNVKDHDGIPLVYSSRTMAENVSAVAAAVRDVSSSQEKIVDVLKELDDKVEDNGDKLDDVLKAVVKQ